MERIRVASVQYFIRPVPTFEQFLDQVSALIETDFDYKCHLLVFPKYFTVQLLILGDVRRPIRQQIVDLAGQVPVAVIEWLNPEVATAADFSIRHTSFTKA